MIEEQNNIENLPSWDEQLLKEAAIGWDEESLKKAGWNDCPSWN